MRSADCTHPGHFIITASAAERAAAAAARDSANLFEAQASVAEAELYRVRQEIVAAQLGRGNVNSRP